MTIPASSAVSSGDHATAAQYNNVRIDAINKMTTGGRLTLVSGTPVTTTDQSTKTTIYFTPHLSDHISIYDGTRFVEYDFTEQSIGLTATQNGTLTNGAATVTGLDTAQLIAGMTVTGTGVPGSTTISSVDSSTQITMSANATADGSQSLTFKIPEYEQVDILAYVDTTVKLKFSPLWTSNTVRATGLSLQNGRYCLTGSLTDLYLGTCRTFVNDGQTADKDIARYLWNYYNRVLRITKFEDITTHTVTTGTTQLWRGFSTSIVNLLVGINDQPYRIKCSARLLTATNGGLATIFAGQSTTIDTTYPWFSNSNDNAIKLSDDTYRAIPNIGLFTIGLYEAATTYDASINNGKLEAELYG